jgi:hypothetical protein
VLSSLAPPARTPKDVAADDVAVLFSTREFAWPMPEETKHRLAAGADLPDRFAWQDVKSSLAEGVGPTARAPPELRPVTASGAKCKCGLEYMPSGQTEIGRPRIYFPRGSVSGARLFEQRCQNSAPKCTLVWEGAAECLVVCSNQTIIAESLFYNTLIAVSFCADVVLTAVVGTDDAQLTIWLACAAVCAI